MTFIVPLLPFSSKQSQINLSTKIIPKSCMRKPKGYWTDEKNLSRELQLFNDTNGLTTSSMPTASKLLAAGRGDLCRAVQRYGGFVDTARRFGRVSVRKEKGYNTKLQLQYIRQQIFQLINQGEIQYGIMPSISVLKKLNRHDLITSIIGLGGFLRVANQLGLVSSRYKKSFLNQSQNLLINSHQQTNQKLSLSPTIEKKSIQVRKKKRKAANYWKDWNTFVQELKSFAETYCSGHMPLQRQLIEHGRSDLLNALRIHGGMLSVARKAGLLPSTSIKRPRGFWSDRSMLHAQMLVFTAKHGHPGLMPTREQLLKAGRNDLVYAIEKYGGYSTIAGQLHLVWHGPSNFWRSFRNVRKRLLAFIKQQNNGRTMPSIQYLKNKGRLDLVYGVALHGGVMDVATRMGLQVVYPERSKEYWEQPTNIQKELEEMVLLQPLENRHIMPTSVAIVEAGRADLATGIRDHGGWVYYAQRLGLRFSFEVRPQGFWQREAEVLRELRNYVIRRYGSWEHPGKPIDNLKNEKNKIKYFPSTEMLKRDGRSDIAFAIERYHGGMASFAQRNQLLIAEDTVLVQPVEELMQWDLFSKALDIWIQKNGVNGMMPTRQDLIRTGRHDLRQATYKHGGFKVVAKRLQLICMETSPKTWLFAWLGMQASNLNQVISLRQEQNLSKTGQELLKTLEKNLERHILIGRIPSSRLRIGQRHKGRREAKPRKKFRVGTKGARNRASVGGSAEARFQVTREGLDRLRKRYRHLPDDNLKVL